MDEPESCLEPEMPADHEALIALGASLLSITHLARNYPPDIFYLTAVKAELRRVLPSLCRTSAETLELPVVNLLVSPPDLKRDGLPVVKLGLSFSDWKYLRVLSILSLEILK
jgi:hypothetical protein